MSNADLIERLRNAATFGTCLEAADAIAAADKLIAELEDKDMRFSRREPTALRYQLDEAERKLAVARQALESCGVNHGLNGPQQYYDESLVDTALAQIGGDE